jgi:hypothetical protein
MKKYRKETVETIQSLTCDICKKTYDVDKDWEEAQEFVIIEEHCGFGSIFGDDNIIRLDMCQHCFKEKLGEFVRVEEE